MEYSATKGVVLYWKPDQPFFIHRAHNVWFDEYNSCISIEDKHNKGSLLIRQDPGSRVPCSYLLNLIPCELGLKSIPFFYTKILTYEIELPPSGKKLVLIYWMMKILQSHISMIQYQIHQLVINFHCRLKKCVDHLYQ